MFLSLFKSAKDTMNGFYQCSLFVLLNCLMASCSEDINLFSQGDAIPAVYCFLNNEDSIQYLRISSQYSVIGNPEILKPDSSDLIVKDDFMAYLAETNSKGEQICHYFKTSTAIIKDSGWFPRGALQVYETKCAIVPNTVYTLYVYFSKGKRMVFARTTSFGGTFHVIDPGLVPGKKLNLYPGEDFYLRYEPLKNAAVYQTTAKFLYDDIRDGIAKRMEFVLTQPIDFEDKSDMNYIEQRISGDQFLLDVSRHIPQDSTLRRRPIGFNFHVSVGGVELAWQIKRDLDISSFSSADYSSFENAVGLFSSLSHKYIETMPLSKFTIDSLALNSFTRNLGFLTFDEINKLDSIK